MNNPNCLPKRFVEEASASNYPGVESSARVSREIGGSVNRRTDAVGAGIRYVRHERTRRRVLAAFALVFFTAAASTSVAQVNQWSLPPYSVDWGGGPVDVLSLPNSCYQRVAPSGPHAAITDTAGNLAAFITNGWLYDRNGACVAEISSGGGEVLVIPVPGSGTRFYVVTSAHDRGTKQYVFTNTYYGTVDIDGRVSYSYDARIMETRGWKFRPMAVSAEYVDGYGDVYRNLYVQRDSGLTRFQVTDYGISGGVRIELEAMPTSTIMPYAEMELHERVEHGDTTSRLAMTFGDTVVVYDLHHDSTATVLTKIHVDVAAEWNPSSLVTLPGIEFSPNGQYLFVTSVQGLRRFEVDSNGTERPLSATIMRHSLPFMSSQIETGPDGNLYLAGPGGLARFRNPNSPHLWTWDTDAVMINDLMPIDLPIDDFTGESKGRCYVLPDEIDRIWNVPVGPVVAVEDGSQRRDDAAHGGVLQLGRPYPNPARNSVTVAYTAARSLGEGRVRLCDAMGRCVRETAVPGRMEAGEGTQTLDVSGLVSGTYFVSIEAGGLRATRPVQVMR